MQGWYVNLVVAAPVSQQQGLSYDLRSFLWEVCVFFLCLCGSPQGAQFATVQTQCRSDGLMSANYPLVRI